MKTQLYIERARRPLYTNHDTWLSKRWILAWTIQSQRKEKRKKKYNQREQLKIKRESPHLHFSFLSFFLLLFLPLSITICPSTYLPVHLYLSLLTSALSLAFRTFASLNQGIQARTQVRVYKCTYVNVHVCTQPVGILPLLEVISNICYIMIVRSVLDRCELFLLAVPREKNVRPSSERDFDSPSTRIKDPFAVLYAKASSCSSSSFLRMRYA